MSEILRGPKPTKARIVPLLAGISISVSALTAMVLEGCSGDGGVTVTHSADGSPRGDSETEAGGGGDGDSTKPDVTDAEIAVDGGVADGTPASDADGSAEVGADTDSGLLEAGSDGADAGGDGVAETPLVDGGGDAGADGDVSGEAVAEIGVSDTGTTDTAKGDTGVTDTGVTDTGVTDTGVTDTGVTDTGVPDTGVPDTGVADTAPVVGVLASGLKLSLLLTPGGTGRKGSSYTLTSDGKKTYTEYPDGDILPSSKGTTGKETVVAIAIGVGPGGTFSINDNGKGLTLCEGDPAKIFLTSDKKPIYPGATGAQDACKTPDGAKKALILATGATKTLNPGGLPDGWVCGTPFDAPKTFAGSIGACKMKLAVMSGK